MEQTINLHQTNEVVIVNVPGPTEQIAVSVRTDEVVIQADTFYVGNLPGTGTPGASSYEHNQIVPAADWHITHNLGYRPAGIQVVDSAGNAWWPNVTYDNVNSVSLNFGTASFAGRAYLS